MEVGFNDKALDPLSLGKGADDPALWACSYSFTPKLKFFRVSALTLGQSRRGMWFEVY